MSHIIQWPDASDTELFSATPDTQYSSENGGGVVFRIDVGTLAGKGTGIHRGLWTFDLSPVNRDFVGRAVFRMFADTVNLSLGSPCELVRVTQAGLVVPEATWNSYATGQAWTTPGGDFTEDNKAAFTAPTSPGWVQVDVTGMAQDALDDDGTLRILGKLVTEDTGVDDRFRTWQADDGDIFPQLVIGYNNPPASLSSGLASGMGFGS